ncbi:MAG: ABC-type amino acid transport substrate-binding protein [Halopseudomonas sp.]|jgi:polar amino acid transport system substrate-binding protein|uniref:transporter substrate-binding domain-containing protein n=1 Tax=Halopseudomonas sp. TaxID=2901191 RepID=UPI0039E51ACE
MVGGYVFPPFSEQNSKGEWSGLIIDLIALLNVSQKDYQFEFMPTAAPRRYHDFANGRFDLMFSKVRTGGGRISRLSVCVGR